MSSDPRHPEGFRIARDLHDSHWEARDLSDAEWEGQLTDVDLINHHPDAGDRWRDADGYEALAYARQMDDMRRWGWCRP